MQSQNTSLWKPAIQSGLIAGGVAVLLSLVGMVATFNQRFIISGVFSMGQVIFLAPMLLMSYFFLRKTMALSSQKIVLYGLLIGVMGGLVLVLLVLLGTNFNLQAMFINSSSKLYDILTFNQPLAPGLMILLALSAVMGVLASGSFLIPPRISAAVIQGITWVLLVGLLRDLIITVTSRWGPLAGPVKSLFAVSGLKPLGAIFLFALISGLYYWRNGKPVSPAQKPTQTKDRSLLFWAKWAGLIILLLLLPPILGIFFSDILDTVFMYILMGIGLNIVVGFAGLLDLGYVAFFAIGAYTMGVLTSPELNADPMTYWQALPFAMIACVVAGLILGLPVLKMRGDYLAIVTLGFGEIVRLLALSDWLRPWFGGSQGIQLIAQPVIGNMVLNTQQELYYLFLLGVGIVAFIAWRLRDSRMGRTWMAIREDEDVAIAMGINHVAYKLMAFATGALFSGIAGTIFAAKLQSVYPHSMNFLVSINVLCLIIIGGMGSIPGVFVGSLVLMGSPELLREFAEYRYLVYGALLVVMMLTRPEGLWPDARRKLELHEEELEAEAHVLAEAETSAMKSAK
ncbi:MAG: leucine/isoleucine/valine transporter permease subunit [Anaerolineales bacterium]|nr:branched-chain amino acid ABC transporter permease [Anaerolineae bacterium]PWB75750.1 MAG: leucine/isoleucine/valine transporter permease subunit [Anaerolineales bacterium]